jgi:hypothetical protein
MRADAEMKTKGVLVGRDLRARRLISTDGSENHPYLF